MIGMVRERKIKNAKKMRKRRKRRIKEIYGVGYLNAKVRKMKGKEREREMAAAVTERVFKTLNS